MDQHLWRDMAVEAMLLQLRSRKIRPELVEELQRAAEQRPALENQQTWDAKANGVGTAIQRDLVVQNHLVAQKPEEVPVA